MAKGGGASRPRFRLLPTLLLAAAILLLPTAVYAWGRNSGSFAVKRISVAGTHVVPARTVLKTLRRDYLGHNLFTVTTAEVRRSLAPLPYIAAVAVDRAFPDGLRVRVTEYDPALYAYAAKRWYVVSADGHVVCRQSTLSGARGDQAAASGGGGATGGGSAAGAGAALETTSGAGGLTAGRARLLETLTAGPRGAALSLPRMALSGSLRPGTTAGDEGMRAALAVLESLPRSVREQIAVVEAAPGGQLTLRFAGGPLVTWGTAVRSAAKTLALRAVLARYAAAHATCTFLDVSVPDRVLARPVLK
jgi:hypothetical protein